MSSESEPAAVTVDVVTEIGPAPASEALETAVRAALAERVGGWRGDEKVDVSVLVTGDLGIAELHGRFLDDPTETDVMSFETDEGCFDVVVNLERATREAGLRAIDASTELSLYVVHGVLHCVGYDDHDDEVRAVMRAAELRVMRRLGLHSPQIEHRQVD